MAAARRLRGLCLVFAASSALKLPALRARRPAHAPAPAIFTADDARPIVLFDGECNLCNAGVNILLDYDACSRDDRGNLRVAALQSTVGRLLLSRLSAEQRARAVDAASGEYSSIVVAGMVLMSATDLLARTQRGRQPGSTRRVGGGAGLRAAA